MNISGVIVGLGNPGKEYDNTRHNLGFMVADHLLKDAQRFSPDACSPLSIGKKKYDAWKCRIGTSRNFWLIIKPMTYMNLSGEAVGHACNYFDIEPEQVIVLHDELDLPLGRMKFKIGGGHAGHNGLRSIEQHLGSRNFNRMRLGIGKPEHGSVSNYVLNRFTKAESTDVEMVLEGARKGLEAFVSSGFDEAVKITNAFKLP